MTEFSLMGAAFCVGIVCFAAFMIYNVGRNVRDDIC